MKRLSKIVVLIGALLLLFFILANNYNFDIFFSQIGSERTLENEEGFINELRTAMLERREQVVLQYKGSPEEVNEFVRNAVDKAFLIDDPNISSDFDYMKCCYKAMQITIKGILNAFTVTYNFEYNETKEQTEEVDRLVKKLMVDLKMNDKTEYEKIKTIHDYIIVNTQYDLSLEKNTAYDNLVLKTSVCQGYAMLTYKMMLEAGIDTRIITGRGKDVSHAWNIVKLDDKWYNIDCTWDDPVSEDGMSHLEYKYFLKSNADFIDHIRDEEFTTEQFMENYPIAKNSY